MNSFENTGESMPNSPKDVFEERERYLGEVAVWANEFAQELGLGYRAEVSVSEDTRRWDGDYVRAEIFSTETNERISVSLFPFGEPEEPADQREREAMVKESLKQHFELAVSQR